MLMAHVPLYMTPHQDLESSRDRALREVKSLHFQLKELTTKTQQQLLAGAEARQGAASELADVVRERDDLKQAQQQSIAEAERTEQQGAAQLAEAKREVGELVARLAVRDERVRELEKAERQAREAERAGRVDRDAALEAQRRAEEEWEGKLQASEQRNRAALALLRSRLDEAYRINEGAEGKVNEVQAWRESTLGRLRAELVAKEHDLATATAELGRFRDVTRQRVQLLITERDRAMALLEDNGCCAHCDRVQGGGFKAPGPRDHLYITTQPMA